MSHIVLTMAISIIRFALNISKIHSLSTEILSVSNYLESFRCIINNNKIWFQDLQYCNAMKYYHLPRLHVHSVFHCTIHTICHPQFVSNCNVKHHWARWGFFSNPTPNRYVWRVIWRLNWILNKIFIISLNSFNTI